MVRSKLPAFGLGALLASAVLPDLAMAQDADGDGAPDAADAFPCDGGLAAVSYAPAQGAWSLLAFEDQWPGATDLDFNDVVVRTHYRIYDDAAGFTQRVLLVVDPVALGGDYSNGLGVQLPIAAAGATVRRRVAGGPWTTLPLEADTNLTAVLSGDLRELYAHAQGRLNSNPSLPSLLGDRLEVEITLPGAATLHAAEAPFDVFVFRSGDLTHQIHFPSYRGTLAMDASLFNTDQDASSPGRSFVHLSGIPAALNLQGSATYPAEGVAVSAVFPNITTFASSGGAQAADFYASQVVSSAGVVRPAAAPPTEPAVDSACTVNVIVGAGTPASPRAWSDGTYAASCNAYRNPGAGHQYAGSTGDGVYRVDAAGTPVDVFCDMTTDGGGWMALYDASVDTAILRNTTVVLVGTWQEFSWGLGRYLGARTLPGLATDATELRYHFVRNANCRSTGVTVQGYNGYGYAYIGAIIGGNMTDMLGFGDAWGGSSYKQNTSWSTCSISSWNNCTSNQRTGYDRTQSGTIALPPFEQLQMAIVSSQCDGITSAWIR